MAEIDNRVTLYNTQQTEVQLWVNHFREQRRSNQRLRSVVESLLDYRSVTLERMLTDNGLAVCHHNGRHFVSKPPKKWELSEEEWKLALFPEKLSKFLYRAHLIIDYGGNPRIKVLDPKLITLCPKHYPLLDIRIFTKQGEDGWHQTLQSGLTQINGISCPKADLRITIDKSVPRITKHTERVYEHFGFLPLPSNFTV